MVNKTKEYEMFIFRDDNRAKIIPSDVEKLAFSIQTRNLLEFRPILVNEKMEIIDGQHRILAAKSLGVDIYYEIQKKLLPEDIIALNVTKNWGLADYLNFYIKHGNENYIELQKTMTKLGLSLRVALRLTSSLSAKQLFSHFRNGMYKFDSSNSNINLDVHNRTIECIKRFNGYSPYCNSSRFWLSLLKLFTHPEFDKQRWLTNAALLVSKFGPKATGKDFDEMFLEIYNYRARERLSYENEKSNMRPGMTENKKHIAKARERSLFDETNEPIEKKQGINFGKTQS